MQPPKQRFFSHSLYFSLSHLLIEPKLAALPLPPNRVQPQVVSLTGPSPIPGIGGTGGSCSHDQPLGKNKEKTDEIVLGHKGQPLKTAKNRRFGGTMFLFVYQTFCLWDIVFVGRLMIRVLGGLF